MAGVLSADSKDGRMLYKRYTMAKGDWDNWRSLYDEAYAFAIPQRDPWPQDTVEGRRKNIQVYDITAVNSVRRLVARLQASLTPTGEQWFLLEAGENVKDPTKKKEINAYLQLFTDIIFQVLNDSNFDIAIAELYQDMCIGTGGMMIMPSNDKRAPVRFKSVGVDLIYPEADIFDDLNTVWRDFNDILGSEIKRMWPKAVLTQTMRLAMEADPMVKFQLLEGVVYYPEKSLWRVVVMDTNSNEYILDQWTPSSPWVVARWSKSTNEIGGRGPVIEALPTIRSLNALVEEIMRNVALSTSPPWVAASDGVFNPYLFKIEPNKIIPVSRQSMNGLPLQRLDVASDINLSSLEVNDMRAQIKDALFDNPVRPVNAPQQTATEIMIRQQQFMEEIGPAFGRISVELLPKIINRVIYIMQAKGYLPKELKVDNKNVTIRYKSPLVRGTAMQKIQNLQNYVAVLQPIAGPELTFGSLNVELLPQWLSNQLDVDESLVKDPGQIQEVLKNIAAQSNPQSPALTQPPPNQPLANQVNQNKAMGT